jgi:hypothetical protein
MRWLRRLLYFFLFFLWLGVALFPCMAFSLAMNQQAQIGQSEGSHVRVFLLQEAKNEGVGVVWKRPLLSQSACYKTTVSYLMWVGQGENVAYCECPDPQTGEFTRLDGQSCR